MASSLLVPDAGLALRLPNPSGDASPEPPSKPVQAMSLNLAQNTLDELLQCLRDDKKARIRLGKHASLHFGSKSQPFCTRFQPNRSELYASSPTDSSNLYFSGVLSHTLEVQKAQNDTASTDEALANLEQSLNAFEKGKESKRTPLIATIDQMRALKAGDNRTATGKEAASLARKSTSRADVEKERFFKNAANRSTPASPALFHSRSPNSVVTPTAPKSAPLPSQNKDKIRLDALRVPLIHLLAVRPVSVKFLAQRTRASQDDCMTLIQKYGSKNRLDQEKYDLRDKAYKELDVWNFPYPSQDERQEAIDNAVSAFDRLRIAKQDKLWQILLPKNERGKGKVLSRLNLRTGPVAKSVTPRINVQASEDVPGDGFGTGNESEAPTNNGRLTPRTPDGARTPSTKANTPSHKKRPLEKALSTKRAPPKPKNTTLTGKVTKKTDKKPEKKMANNSNNKADTKFKSAEFVVDSDEDTEMADAPPAKQTLATASKSENEGPEVKKRPPPLKKPQTKAAAAAPSANSTPTASTTTTARVPNSNKSPVKPSPLGSSPPTNASDFESGPRSSRTSQSSSSSSPLIHQLPRQRAVSNAKPSLVEQKPPSRNVKPVANPLKRKAPPEEVSTAPRNNRTFSRPVGLGISQPNGRGMEVKRRRPSSLSSGDSTSGSASPPISQTILRQRLKQKSQQFKQYYSKYRLLHEDLANHPDPPLEQIRKLERQHGHLQNMKQEIWDEDRRLRMG